MRKTWTLGLATLTAALASFQAWAGALEDAKALLAQKKYEEVDRTLEKVLSQQKVPVEALQVSLEAALGSGKVITAQRRISSILKITQTPDLLYQGAELADRAGETNLAVARYITFATQVNDKGEKLKAALRYLLRQGTYPEELKRYVNVFGADNTSWAIGRALLDRLIRSGEPEKALDLAGFLIEKFPDPKQVSAIHSRLRASVDGQDFGRSDRERYFVPLTVMLKGRPAEAGELDYVFQCAARSMKADERVKYAFAVQEATKGPLGWGSLSHFGAMRELPTDEARLDAGRKFLALEPLFANSRDQPSAQLYDQYLSLIDQSPQVFNIKDRVLVTGDQMVQKFNALKTKTGNDPAALGPRIQNIRAHYLGDNTPAAVAFLRQNINVLQGDRLNELLEYTKGENFEAVLAEAAKGRGYNDLLDLSTRAWKWWNAAKNRDKLVASAKEYMSAFPASFDWRRVRGEVMDSALLDIDAKIGLLQEMAQKAGYSGPLSELLKNLHGERGAKDWKAWSENKRFQDFRQEFEKKPAGGDLAMRTLVALWSIRGDNHRYDENVQKLGREFLKSYPAHGGKIPGGWEQTKNVADVLAVGIFAKQAEQGWENSKAMGEWAEMWAPRLTLGSAWDSLANRMAGQRQGAILYKVAQSYLALTQGGEKGSPAVWAALRGAVNPRTEKKSAFAAHYDKLGGENALAYLIAQEEAMEPQAIMDEMAAIVARPDSRLTSRELANSLLNALYQKTGAKSKPPVNLTQALWNFYLAEEEKTGNYNPVTEAYAYGQYTMAERPKEAAEHLARYLEAIKKRPVPAQLEAYATVHQAIPRETEKKLVPGQRVFTLLKQVKPLYEQIPPAQWSTTAVYSQFADDTNELATTWEGQEKQDGLKLGSLFVDMALEGARLAGQGGSLLPMVQRRVQEAIAKEDWVQAGRLTRFYASVVGWTNDWDKSYREHILPTIELLETKKAFEIAYVFLSEIERRNRPNETVAKQLVMLKSKESREIPELVPVDKTDPTYDLHVASQALGLGNEGKAWELTAPRLKLLPQTWMTLDPNYVAWCVEQMRKQKMLKEGLELAFTILLREVDLDPEVVAKVSLTKGDTYADMQNYQAARIEYEGLQNNPRYKRTEAGSRAQYRLIQLLILTKDYTAAEGLLERLVDSDSLETQAEAYYLKARISFDQADYPQAKDLLKEVFRRRSDHVESRLLEGELKLLVPRGLASTEVLVGNPTLRTIVIPGRALTLKLQDANLSIARGGASIPVIVKTTKGGDEEEVKLLPSASEKNLFSGTLQTGLGKIEKNDLILEVRGDDTITYMIKPDFQKANSLNYPEKTLEVRFDARLVASAGEILSEEETEKRALERQIQAARGEESRRFEGRSGNTVRPGSPIYIQVSDFSQDFTDAPDKVKVTLKTTSGDVFEGFELAETGPHTGLFRGAVPTSIPFPKATASDTEEGKDPSVVINAGKQGVWASLADSNPPKWLEIDTMSSHAVKSVAIDLPGRDKVKCIALVGMLADAYELLAVFPKEARGFGLGLTAEYFADRELKNRKSLRIDPLIDFDWTQMAPTGFTNDAGYAIRWTGKLQPRYTEDYTLATISDDGARLWIDGKLLIDNWQEGAASEKQANVRLSAGKKHDIKIEYFQKAGEAVMKLLWASKNQKREVVPQTQLYPSDGSSGIQIAGEMTATDTGFTATLSEPKRLRRVKWIFEDFTGPAVAVRKVTLKDAEGKTIVPGPFDVTAGAANRKLQVAPGDRIEVTYVNEKRATAASSSRVLPGTVGQPDRGTGTWNTLTAALNSSYYNGAVILANEVIKEIKEGENTQRFITYQPAKRCKAGDQLMAIVTDYDEDLTNDRDTVPIQVTTSSGEKLTLKALETWVNGDEEQQKHSGVYLALLRIGNTTEKDTIKVQPGDTITVGYWDKENTKPGIPFERTYTVEEAGRSRPALVVYRTNTKMVEDKGEDAKARLRRMRMRGKQPESLVIYKEQVEARKPYSQKEEGEAPAEPIAVCVSAPLLLEVTYPRAAMNSGSLFNAILVSESEMKAAAKANRKPTELKVPMCLKTISQLAAEKGYPIVVLRPNPAARAQAEPGSGKESAKGPAAPPAELKVVDKRKVEDLLREGTFAGVVRLQIGSPGDPINDLVMSGPKEFARPAEGEDPNVHRVPSLIVSGSDTVHIKVAELDAKESADTKVRLLSDARLELLDETYTAQRDAIHLGDQFYAKLTDPDQDTSDAQDKVTVKVKASSGDALDLTLTETLPHSGIFTAALKPEFAGEKKEGKAPAVNAADQTLSVCFGDEVTCTYVDQDTLASKEPLEVTAKGRMHYGSDAELAVFTKLFKDPEMAVKTRFLMAEALFEMAKEHRKLNQPAIADDEIAHGKMVLEEALRDYPNTSVVGQGEFLLANLAQELNKHQEAIGRYSNIISNWPDSEYAPRAQFKKAICLEKMENYDQACEEYVRLTYIYPESNLVADATVRLANYYYKQKSFRVAGKIFFNFQQRTPQHPLACKALFLSAQCHMKLEDYKESCRLFTMLVDEYPDDKEIRSEAMYWLGDSYFKGNTFEKAYQTFKKLTWDYPESKWAKIARGRLTEEALSRFDGQM